ncbi:helix-turn-helix domain-containing protein [Eoetvoesiella caeni]|uniref:AraC-like protein n=1 Tax=Eoetvoesiella caeni TaxID=645616 RepID=A0A366H8W6_9BURK|nr:helix-turn-helix domain-containing protein [Eoetvoesiella caeni]MCI2809900.1 helix-turn-helix domain-containing protein [Eoetvoesiella caeni]NYT56183.1 helix-turn-helix domain-containing protein [Eoetvoesiella caeni]RBP38240.1 AraC-like protein [Eoetvoesiella caeni]
MIPFASVGPEDGFDHWHQVTCRNYSHTECRAIPDECFSATVTTQSFGKLILSNISSRIRSGNELGLWREPAHIRKDGREEFFLWVGREGKTMLEQHGRVATLLPGQIMLMDQTKPFKLVFGEISATTLIIVDRPQLTSRVPWIEAAAARAIPADMPWSRLFVSLVDSVVSATQTPNRISTARMEIMALDMWAEILDLALAGDSTKARPYRQKLQQAQSFLRANLDDPDLDNDVIARAVNLSSRTLLRLFAEEGTTPMRWLMQERLRASHQALEHHRFERVTDVAFAFGFRNLSHFSRSFKAVHGVSPQQLLRRR